MTDPIALGQALTSIRTASTIASGLVAAAGSIKKAELQLQIANLAEALVAARLAVLSAQEEIVRLQEEVRSLREAAQRTGQIVKRRGLAYVREEDGSLDGPFCPRCLEVEGRQVSLTELHPAMRHFGAYLCPNCDQQVGTILGG